MLWATPALLGVPPWIVAGGLAAMLWSRSRFTKDQAVELVPAE